MIDFRMILLWGCLLNSWGCSLLLDEPEVVECTTDLHCLESEVCNEGLCTPFHGEADVLDAMVTQDSAPMPDMRPMPADAESDLGVTPPYPTGRCFHQLVNPVYRATEASTYIPHGDCNRWSQVVSVLRDGQEHLLLRTGTETALTLSNIRGRHNLAGHYLVVPRFNAQDNATNVARFDFLTGQSTWLNPKSYDQSDATLGEGFSAYIEHRNHTHRVKVQFEDDTIVDCGRDHTRQWGLVAASNWLAWFEQRSGAKRPRLVVTSPQSCHVPSARRERLLADGSAGDHPLIHADNDLLWLASNEAGRSLVWRWQHGVLLSEPAPILDIENIGGHPIEIAANGRYLAIVNYQPVSPPYGLTIYNLETAELREIPTIGNVHRPTVTDHYLIWAEGGGHTGWELRYATLED
jgi:hypothetical protein